MNLFFFNLSILDLELVSKFRCFKFVGEKLIIYPKGIANNQNRLFYTYETNDKRRKRKKLYGKQNTNGGIVIFLNEADVHKSFISNLVIGIVRPLLR